MNTSNIIEITDFQAPELDVYARLSENQLLNRCEPEKGMFIAESPRVIERALDAGGPSPALWRRGISKGKQKKSSEDAEKSVTFPSIRRNLMC